MKNVMLIYPPGKKFQRSEDRAQCNIDDSAVTTVHACNDLGYAASVLRNKGYGVFLCDYQTEEKSFSDVERDVKSFKPDMIFISITNSTIYDDLCFINLLKDFTDAEIVIKGAIFYNIENELLDKLDLNNVDVLIGGESNFVIGDITDALLEGNTELDSIPGIVFKKDGKYVKTDFSCYNDNLDSLPFPARDLMNNALYKRPDTGEPMATIQTSIGCPSKCIYCLTPVISGTRVRFRSTDNVFEEIKECYYKYNIKSFFFKADTFTINQKWAIELCDKIINSEMCGDISFTVNSRANTLSDKLCEKLKKAGCFMIAVGFESASDETLKKIKKGTTVEDNINAINMIKRAKIPLFGFFMIGFPWETEADIKKTLNFALKHRLDYVEMHTAMPFYSTELYELCKEYGVLNDSSFGFDYMDPNTTGTKYVPMERIVKLKKSFLFRFYSNPYFVMGKIADCIKHPYEIKNYAYYGIRLLKNLFK
ncbi:MAG: radical SAM protein [Eubacterium sp.]|nr:radical SAM protein [Eubacterium sp.]